MDQVDQSTLKYRDKQINSTHCTDLLGVTLDWLDIILARAYNQSDYQVKFRLLLHQNSQIVLSIENLRMVCFAYVHSVIACGLPFWGNAVNSIMFL
jgi:hypothetical protein